MPPTGLLEGTAGGLAIPATALRTGHAFLNDIAHHAAPGFVDHDHNPATPKIALVADSDVGDVNGDGTIDAADLVADDGNPLTYDNEMLDAHFVTGDGRGNENIGLTAVHTIFHSEHNRLVEVNKDTIIASGDLAVINEWLLTPLATLADIPTTPAGDRRAELEWRAPVPGGTLRHRDAVSASGIRGICPQDPAERRRVRLHELGGSRPGNRRRVRPCGLPVRPLDADRYRRSARQHPQPRQWRYRVSSV